MWPLFSQGVEDLEPIFTQGLANFDPIYSTNFELMQQCSRYLEIEQTLKKFEITSFFKKQGHNQNVKYHIK